MATRQQAAAELLRRRQLRRDCQRLSGFARHAWPVLEPATPLRWGWPLDAICDHLEAVSRGEIRRLLMNVPPGTMKSLLTGVLWPAWEWGPLDRQEMRFLGTAHKEPLAIRDSLKCRRVITSPWYQGNWPVELLADQNAKMKFENSRTGFREAMPFGSMTGSRGDRVVLDDPLSADEGNSEADLLSARITFLEGLPTRINNDESAIVVIMQRLAEGDTSGVILDQSLPYVHLMLPMRFEEERRCYTVVCPTTRPSSPVLARYQRRKQRWWLEGDTPPEDVGLELEREPTVLVHSQDPRTEEGELMFPDRFPAEQVEELERTLGSYAAAGQLQQRPSPRGGGIFKREWFKPMNVLPTRVRMARGWDLASTPDQNAAATAGVLVAKTVEPVPRYIIVDVRHDRLSPAGVERLLRSTAEDDVRRYGRGVRGSLPQDPGQAGKTQKLSLLSGPLAKFNYGASPESGDKVTRALPLAAQAEAGNVYYLVAPWNQAFFDELTNFPAGKFKDQVDAASRAFSVLTSGSGWYTPEVYLEAYA